MEAKTPATAGQSDIRNVGKPTVRSRQVGPTYFRLGPTNIRQAVRHVNSLRKGGKSGLKRTPSLGQLYGALIKHGLARIVRKRGRPPRVQLYT